MGMVAPEQRIASAFFVIHGSYGEVTRYAQERGVCRQWIYREAAALRNARQPRGKRTRDYANNCGRPANGRPSWKHGWPKRWSSTLRNRRRSPVSGKHAASASRDCCELLQVLLPGQTLSVAQLGRRTQAAGKKAGELLAVLDKAARQKVREAAADEIYVKDPVLMVVEPESLCWLSGRLSDEVSGEVWRASSGSCRTFEQVMRDGGTGLAKGVALVNEERQEQGQNPLTDQGDHFHAARHGGVGMNKAQRQARKALAAAEAAQKELDECARQGQSRTGIATRASHAWKKAEQAMDTWQERERVWQKTKQALPLITPDGALNTREQAEAVLAETLPQLPDSDFAKVKRQLQQPEMLNYLDRVQAKMAALPFAEEVKQAAVRQEALRRRPEALQGENPKAAALRGMLLLCAVVLSKAGDEGPQAVAAVKDIFRRAYRASSLVECINSVLRMHQAGHRRMTQGLLDLKRLYWNCHTFVLAAAARQHPTSAGECRGRPVCIGGMCSN